MRANIRSAIDTLKHEAKQKEERAGKLHICDAWRVHLFGEAARLIVAANVLEEQERAEVDARRMKVAKEILSGLPEHLKAACRKILSGEQT